MAPQRAPLLLLRIHVVSCHTAKLRSDGALTTSPIASLQGNFTVSRLASPVSELFVLINLHQQLQLEPEPYINNLAN
jgi:hypothetical protein